MMTEEEIMKDLELIALRTRVAGLELTMEAVVTALEKQGETLKYMNDSMIES